MFVYQSTSLDYYESMEDSEVEKKPILMCLKRLKKITYDHLNMQR